MELPDIHPRRALEKTEIAVFNLEELQREPFCLHGKTRLPPTFAHASVSNFQYSHQISTKTIVVKCYYLNYVKCKTMQTLLVSGSLPPTP